MIFSHLTPMKKDSNRGFTLIELMVVISIIAVLSSIMLAAFSVAKSSAYDAQYAEEVHQLQIAFQIAQTGGVMKYAQLGGECDVYATDCEAFDIRGLPTFDQTLSWLVTDGYISQIPHYNNYTTNSDVVGNYFRGGYPTPYVPGAGTVEYFCGAPPNVSTWNPSLADDNGVFVIYATPSHKFSLPQNLSSCVEGNGTTPACAYYATSSSIIFGAVRNVYCLQL